MSGLVKYSLVISFEILSILLSQLHYNKTNNFNNDSAMDFYEGHNITTLQSIDAASP